MMSVAPTLGFQGLGGIIAAWSVTAVLFAGWYFG